MDPLRQLRSQLGLGMARAWDALAEGWREILSRSSNALTHYDAPTHGRPEPGTTRFPEWGLLAAETWETAQAVIVRVEIPGMNKEDLQVAITGNVLRIRGEKRSGGEPQGRLYQVMERAFGRFERTVPLSHGVDAEHAEVSYLDGVLTVILQKTEPVPPHELPVP